MNIPKPDLWILDYIYTPVSQFLGRQFGLKNSTLVKQSTGAWIASNIVMEFYGDEFHTPLAIGATVIFGGLMALKLYSLAENADKSPNPNLYLFGFERILGIFFVILDVITLNYIFYSWIIWVSSVYFACCPTAPPKKAKEKRFVAVEQPI
jgi:hypothetical protein